MYVDAGPLCHSGHATVVPRVAWFCMGDPQSVIEWKTNIRFKQNIALYYSLSATLLALSDIYDYVLIHSNQYMYPVKLLARNCFLFLNILYLLCTARYALLLRVSEINVWKKFL